MVLNKRGPGIGVGIGAERELNARWSVLATAEFAAAPYDLTALETQVIAAFVSEDPRFNTRSFAASAMLQRRWSWGADQRNQFSLGGGLLSRLLSKRALVEAVVPVDRDGVQRFEYTRGSFGRKLENLAGLALRADYKLDVGSHTRLGAFCRYEFNFTPNTNPGFRDFGDFYPELEGEVYSLSRVVFEDYIGGARAMSYGLTLQYVLR